MRHCRIVQLTGTVDVALPLVRRLCSSLAAERSLGRRLESHLSKPGRRRDRARHRLPRSACRPRRDLDRGSPRTGRQHRVLRRDTQSAGEPHYREARLNTNGHRGHRILSAHFAYARGERRSEQLCGQLFRVPFALAAGHRPGDHPARSDAELGGVFRWACDAAPRQVPALQGRLTPVFQGPFGASASASLRSDCIRDGAPGWHGGQHHHDGLVELHFLAPQLSRFRARLPLPGRHRRTLDARYMPGGSRASRRAHVRT